MSQNSKYEYEIRIIKQDADRNIELLKFCFLEETPNFSLVQERLDNGSPSIKVTFPDGYSDLLVLNHFYDKENRPEGCHFMGHLENEPDSCIGTNN